LKKDKGKISPGVLHPKLLATDAEGLARASPNEKVNCAWFNSPGFEFGDASIVFGLWVMMRQDCVGKGVDFRQASTMPAKVFPSYRCSFNATEAGKKCEGSFSHWVKW
jgi:hypothetical protein